jgi:hypothetical protein
VKLPEWVRASRGELVNDETVWWGWVMPWWVWLLMLVAALVGAGLALLWLMWYLSKVFRR